MQRRYLEWRSGNCSAPSLFEMLSPRLVKVAFLCGRMPPDDDHLTLVWRSSPSAPRAPPALPLPVPLRFSNSVLTRRRVLAVALFSSHWSRPFLALKRAPEMVPHTRMAQPFFYVSIPFFNCASLTKSSVELAAYQEDEKVSSLGPREECACISLSCVLCRMTPASAP